MQGRGGVPSAKALLHLGGHQHPDRCAAAPAAPAPPGKVAVCPSAMRTRASAQPSGPAPGKYRRCLSAASVTRRDLAELISKETNQLGKCKFVFYTKLETHYTKPLLSFSDWKSGSDKEPWKAVVSRPEGRRTLNGTL